MLGPRALGLLTIVAGLLGLGMAADALWMRSWTEGAVIFATTAALIWEWKVSRHDAPRTYERMLMISITWMALYQVALR